MARLFQPLAILGVIIAIAFSHGRELRGAREIDEVVDQVHNILKNRKMSNDEARELAASLLQTDFFGADENGEIESGHLIDEKQQRKLSSDGEGTSEEEDEDDESDEDDDEDDDEDGDFYSSRHLVDMFPIDDEDGEDDDDNDIKSRRALDGDATDAYFSDWRESVTDGSNIATPSPSAFTEADMDLNESTNNRRALRKRRRRRKSSISSAITIKAKDRKYLTEGSTCLAIYEEINNRDADTAFSTCANSAYTTAMLNQNDETCLEYNRTECKQTNGCMWVGTLWAANTYSSVKTSEASTCVPDPCFRINNGHCTIQHTGGRCVWYTKEMNAARGFSTAGCYQSPCNNPLKNTPKGCVASGNDFYQCNWCGSRLGCQNAELTSKAQCWNMGKDSGCTSCMVSKTSETPNCKTDKCSENCCQSPYCECIKKYTRSATDVALDIED